MFRRHETRQRHPEPRRPELHFSPLLLTARRSACTVRAMDTACARVEQSLSPVAVDNTGTLGYWFYFGFYSSPAVLAERESRTT
jgi:hypothetical protein